MRADDLDHAIELQNATPYGLTGGIHSLDDAEVERWLDGVQVGNAYINRGITGAIVQRQPFGGWKRSSVGCGPKAGGPDYVAEMVTGARRRRSIATSPDRSYSRCVDALVQWQSRSHGSGERDATNSATGSSTACWFEWAPDTPERALAAARHAAELCGTPVVVSDASIEPDDRVDRSAGPRRRRGRASASADRGKRRTAIRLLHRAASRSTASRCRSVAGASLRRWLREQAISRTTHRHGRVAP